MIEPQIIYCPECREDTVQKACIYDPDEPDGQMIWCCTECGEASEFVPGMEDQED